MDRAASAEQHIDRAEDRSNRSADTAREETELRFGRRLRAAQEKALEYERYVREELVPLVCETCHEAAVANERRRRDAADCQDEAARVVSASMKLSPVFTPDFASPGGWERERRHGSRRRSGMCDPELETGASRSSIKFMAEPEPEPEPEQLLTRQNTDPMAPVIPAYPDHAGNTDNEEDGEEALRQQLYSRSGSSGSNGANGSSESGTLSGLACDAATTRVLEGALKELKEDLKESRRETDELELECAGLSETAQRERETAARERERLASEMSASRTELGELQRELEEKEDEIADMICDRVETAGRERGKNTSTLPVACDAWVYSDQGIRVS